MSYKKRPLKTDADSVAAFWNKLEVDKPVIQRFFNYWIRRFPSENTVESFHDLILQFHRLEVFKKFDPSRVTSTATRNHTLEGKYEIYLFRRVQMVLSWAYNDRRVYRKREVLDPDFLTTASQELKSKREVSLWCPPGGNKFAEKKSKKKKKVRGDYPAVNSHIQNSDFMESLEIDKLLSILKEHLTDKQYAIVQMLLNGKTQSEIADEWEVSCTMIGVYLRKIKKQIQGIKGIPMSELLTDYLKNKVPA